MTERFQQLTKVFRRDRFIVACGIAVLADAMIAPIDFLMTVVAVLVLGLVSVFARTMEAKGFEDPVYKKNVQRLIDRNRKLEEAGQ
jgi:hypothetical protein